MLSKLFNKIKYFVYMYFELIFLYSLLIAGSIFELYIFIIAKP